MPFAEQLAGEFGRDLSEIRAYFGPEATKACEAVQASAFTSGNKIAFAEPNPSRQLVAHELAHAVQQAASEQRGSTNDLEASQPGDAAERQAEAIASNPAAGRDLLPVGPETRGAGAGPPAIDNGRTLARTEVPTTAGVADYKNSPDIQVLLLARNEYILYQNADIIITAILKEKKVEPDDSQTVVNVPLTEELKKKLIKLKGIKGPNKHTWSNGKIVQTATSCTDLEPTIQLLRDQGLAKGDSLIFTQGDVGKFKTKMDGIAKMADGAKQKLSYPDQAIDLSMSAGSKNEKAAEKAAQVGVDDCAFLLNKPDLKYVAYKVKKKTNYLYTVFDSKENTGDGTATYSYYKKDSKIKDESAFSELKLTIPKADVIEEGLTANSTNKEVQKYMKDLVGKNQKAQKKLAQASAYRKWALPIVEMLNNLYKTNNDWKAGTYGSHDGGRKWSIDFFLQSGMTGEEVEVPGTSATAKHLKDPTSDLLGKPFKGKFFKRDKTEAFLKALDTTCSSAKGEFGALKWHMTYLDPEIRKKFPKRSSARNKPDHGPYNKAYQRDGCLHIHVFIEPEKVPNNVFTVAPNGRLEPQK